MKSLMMICGLAAGSAILLLAQNSTPLTADIPFSFYAGDVRMAAGEYGVTKAAINAISVRGARGGDAALIIVSQDGGGEPAEKSVIVFRKYGDDRYFLGEIRHEGARASSLAPRSKLEKETVTSTLVTSAKPVEVLILARAR